MRKLMVPRVRVPPTKLPPPPPAGPAPPYSYTGPPFPAAETAPASTTGPPLPACFPNSHPPFPSAGAPRPPLSAVPPPPPTAPPSTNTTSTTPAMINVTKTLLVPEAAPSIFKVSPAPPSHPPAGSAPFPSARSTFPAAGAPLPPLAPKVSSTSTAAAPPPPPPTATPSSNNSALPLVNPATPTPATFLPEATPSTFNRSPAPPLAINSTLPPPTPNASPLLNMTPQAVHDLLPNATNTTLGSTPATKAPAPAAPATNHKAQDGTNATVCPTSASKAPAPAPARTTKEEVADLVDKYLCSVVGTALAVATVYLPLLHYLIYGDFEDAVALWSTRGIEIGLANNVLWLLYGVVVLERDKSYDIILGNSWCGGANLGLLLLLYGRKQQLKKGLLVFTTVMLCTTAALVLLQLEISSGAMKWLEMIFGVAGNFVLFLGHFLQVVDLYKATEGRQLGSALVSVAPNAVLAVFQCISTFIKHRNQIYVVVSSCINGFGYLVEAFLIFEMHIFIKKQSKKIEDSVVGKSLKRMGTSLSHSYRSFKKMPNDDEEKGHQLDLYSERGERSLRRISLGDQAELYSESEELPLDFEEEMDYAEAQILDLQGKLPINPPTYDTYSDEEIEDEHTVLKLSELIAFRPFSGDVKMRLQVGMVYTSIAPDDDAIRRIEDVEYTKMNESLARIEGADGILVSKEDATSPQRSDAVLDREPIQSNLETKTRRSSGPRRMTRGIPSCLSFRCNDA